MVNKKYKKITQEKRLNWLYLTAFFSLTSAGIVFAILCLAHSQIHFIVENATLWRILSVLFFFGLCGVSIFFSIMQKVTAVKVLFSVYFLLLFCLVKTAF